MYQSSEWTPGGGLNNTDRCLLKAFLPFIVMYSADVVA